MSLWYSIYTLQFIFQKKVEKIIGFDIIKSVINKGAFIVLAIILFTSTNIQADTKKDIITYAKKFLNYLQKNNMKNVNNMIFSKIKISPLKKKEIMKLSDDLIMEKIGISQYILLITGHNLHNFINYNSKLIKFEYNKEYGEEKVVNDKIIKSTFYYIKFKISYKKNNKLYKDKTIELNIIKEDDQYKIFGFVL